MPRTSGVSFGSAVQEKELWSLLDTPCLPTRLASIIYKATSLVPRLQLGTRISPDVNHPRGPSSLHGTASGSPYSSTMLHHHAKYCQVRHRTKDHRIVAHGCRFGTEIFGRSRLVPMFTVINLVPVLPNTTPTLLYYPDTVRITFPSHVSTLYTLPHPDLAL
uniref:Uncharacterized protein n=1 Tax=Cacopsylla melanoneura TaxID=428564 RepID=A0A8D8X1R5_9HEMI